MAAAGVPAIMSYTLGAGSWGDAVVFNADQFDPGGDYTQSLIAKPSSSATVRWPDLPPDLSTLYYGNRQTQLFVTNDDVTDANTYADYLALGRTLDGAGASIFVPKDATSGTAFAVIPPQ